MVENASKPPAHMKNIRGVAEKLRIHIGRTLAYECYQQLLNSVAQNNDQSNRDIPPLPERKVHAHEKSDFVLDLVETSDLFKDSCDANSSSPGLLANTMIRGGNNKNSINIPIRVHNLTRIM